MRCVRFDRSHLNVKKENLSVTTIDKVNQNDNFLQSCQEQSISGQSTPIAKKQSANMDGDESPDLDYSPSPILPLCTQDCGNEVAWDWQSSLSRTPESKSKKHNSETAHCETPKGTKLLQRKRNSNSPLLFKPLKRKAIKMEHIENIGEFAAELQALNERVEVIRQNDKNRSIDCAKEVKALSLTNTNDKEELAVRVNKQNSIEKNGDNNDEQNRVEEAKDHNTIKKEMSGSYDDLFDDSVDEDIIRCTQELEEKFNLIPDKGNSMHSQTSIKNEESFCTNDISNKESLQFNSSDNNKETSAKSTLGTGYSNILKTYSKFPLKRDANSSLHGAIQRNTDTHKSYINNNNHTIQPPFQKLCDNKKLVKSNTIDLFDFPDDSFDDWLAACVEDEKLLSNSNGPRKKDDMKFHDNYKRLTYAPLKSESKSADSFKHTAKPQTSNTSFLENRKFFKTKSLSDQYVNRDAIINKSTINGSYHATKSTLSHLNSSRSSIPHTSVARASVSTRPIITYDRKIENTAISLMHGTDRTRGCDVNRCAVKGDGDRFVKHHSTGNMKSDVQKTKTASQPTWCTAKEIERKRLQALARLQARKKFYSTKITNNINR
ncbi:hypothetical protein P5V15_012302 [Pogonomyrmex californicus]